MSITSPLAEVFEGTSNQITHCLNSDMVEQQTATSSSEHSVFEGIGIHTKVLKWASLCDSTTAPPPKLWNSSDYVCPLPSSAAPTVDFVLRVHQLEQSLSSITADVDKMKLRRRVMNMIDVHKADELLTVKKATTNDLEDLQRDVDHILHAIGASWCNDDEYALPRGKTNVLLSPAILKCSQKVQQLRATKPLLSHLHAQCQGLERLKRAGLSMAGSYEAPHSMFSEAAATSRYLTELEELILQAELKGAVLEELDRATQEACCQWVSRAGINDNVDC